MQYRAKRYSTSISAGASTARSAARIQLRERDRSGAPSAMPQHAGGWFAGSGHVADVLHERRIAVGRDGHAALDGVDHRGGREMADQNVARVLVHVAGGGADLIVRVRRDVLHEEIENPGVALQHSEKLQRAVRGFDFGRGRFGRGLRGRRGFRGSRPSSATRSSGQFAPEQKRKKCAKSQYDAIQSRILLQ